MASLGRHRRAGTTAGLALALALVGPASSAAMTAVRPVLVSGGYVVGTEAEDQPAASVTVVDAPRYPVPVQAEPAPPAVEIADTGTVAHQVEVDIAEVLLRAYRSAAAHAPASCHLPVSLLAAIGQVESGSLVGRPLDAQHRTFVLGPLLDGNGFAAIPDTDGGRWDGSTTWDRAVGPMQFIPSTWRRFGADGDGDGRSDPQDVEDAAAATAAYLCYGGRDLSRAADLRSSILSYNHSSAYLHLVLTYQQRFEGLGLDSGVTVVGLPTSLALSATPVGVPDGWEASGAFRREGRAGAGATSPTDRPTRTGPSPSSAPSASPSAGGPHSTPSGSPSGSPSSSPGTPTPGPTGTPTGSPAPTPGGTGTGSPAPDPSACQVPTDGSTTPSPSTATPDPGAVVDPQGDPGCLPCADPATPPPTPATPCDPDAPLPPADSSSQTPAVEPTPVTGSVTPSSPSSGP